MVTQVILRAYTPEGLNLLERVDELIKSNTKLQTVLVDHSNISKSYFDFDDGDKLVSLDRYLAQKFDIPYFQISRIFDINGNVLGRKIGGIVEQSPNIRIIDTDMVHGGTIRLACNIFKTSKVSIPLVIQEDQDLIDIEDLLYNQSLLHTGFSRDFYTNPSSCSYLLNDYFFTKRTSLPVRLYDPLCDLLNKPKAYIHA